MPLEFSTLDLVVGEKHVDLEEIKGNFGAKNENITFNDKNCIVRESSIINDKYLWIYISYGSELPYTPTVYIQKDGKEEPNPRQIDQLELSKQLFCVYSNPKQIMYISNLQQKSLLEHYISLKLKDENILVRHVLKTIDEFSEGVKSIENIKFTKRKNLFSVNDKIMEIFKRDIDALGLGMPDGLTVEFKFSPRQKFISKMTEWLSKAKDAKSRGEIDSLICIGRDEKGIEAVFNLDNFTNKISIDLYKDDMGMYDHEEVRKSIINKLESLNV